MLIACPALVQGYLQQFVACGSEIRCMAWFDSEFSHCKQRGDPALSAQCEFLQLQDSK